MAGSRGAPPPSRRSFSPPADREWAAREHSEGVYFAESATERVGPFPAEAAEREATRRNEYELVAALARVLRREGGGGRLEELERSVVPPPPGRS